MNHSAQANFQLTFSLMEKRVQRIVNIQTLTIKCYTHHDIFDVVISIACFYVTTIINGMKGKDNLCSNIYIIYPKSGLLYSLTCIAYRPFIGI